MSPGSQLLFSVLELNPCHRKAAAQITVLGGPIVSWWLPSKNQQFSLSSLLASLLCWIERGGAWLTEGEMLTQRCWHRCDSYDIPPPRKALC